MLFDLRGRGRRRTVQTVYIGLALLLGVGLIGFGIGGGFGGGGLLNAASNNEGSGGTSYASQIKRLQKLTGQQPNNIGAWERLTSAQLHEAGGEAYVSNGGPTAKGRELFSQTAVSWERYLALNPPQPSVPLDKAMLRLFGEEGLNRPASAVEVLQIVVAAEPDNAAYYSLLAQYAYKAHNVRVGDLAAAKAVKLAPPEQRARVKTELEAAKKSPAGGETLTGTTNGKTFTVKSNGKGGYSGAVPQGTSTTPGSSTPAKK